MADVIQKIFDWSSEKLRRRELDRWGQTRQCPWCRQMVETGGKHSMRRAEHCVLFDTFTCGNCGGESHWEFGPFPIARGLGAPPTPAAWAIEAEAQTQEILAQIRWAGRDG